MFDDDLVCSDCKRTTELVFDHSSGDTVCSECGLVLESHYIQESFEWRNFVNNDSVGDRDPTRVGGSSNPLFTDGSLSTTIAITKGAPLDQLPKRGWNIFSNPERSRLVMAYDTITTMSDRLGLVATIKDRAKELYKRIEDQRTSRGRNQEVLMAACLYIACRQEDKPRTVKEICSVVSNGAMAKREIGRAKEYIVKQLALGEVSEENIGRTIHAGDFMRRFCSNLGMNNQAVKAAQEAVEKSQEFDIRRSPISIAATVIYMITQLSDEKPLKDISIATGVAEVTIRNTYKDLYPHVLKIIPNWFANGKQEDYLKKLCIP